MHTTEPDIHTTASRRDDFQRWDSVIHHGMDRRVRRGDDGCSGRLADEGSAAQGEPAGSARPCYSGAMIDLSGTSSARAAVEDFSSRSLRLDTLVRLRWLAVAGQAAAVMFVHFVLGFPLPLFVCLALVGLSALLNVALARYPATVRLQEWPAFALLAYDVLQLGALLFVTGGLENPFAILLLAPVIVSAATLPPRPTVILGLVVVASASVLSLSHWPLPWRPGEPFELPLVYVAGVWVALVSACAFTGVYAFRVASEARQLAKALNAAEMVLAREQHLYALDGLAAAAAHELGTPLATIALVAKEMERDFPPGSPHADDVALLRSQSQRCRDILARLTSLSGQQDKHLGRLPLSHLIEEVVEAYRAFSAEIVVTPSEGTGPEPVGRRNPAIAQGLVNLVENAVDFAEERVTVGTSWTDAEVAVEIADDGPGFSPDIIDRAGEPYVTTRLTEPSEEPHHEAGGLGLGLFIAKTLLERSGATLRLANRTAPARGAVVRVSWPRAIMDIPAFEEERRETMG
jgi:two-component system sensor histidine kinase RegB